MPTKQCKTENRGKQFSGKNVLRPTKLSLYVVKTHALDKVESELFDLVEATKRSPMFSQFTKDLYVPTGVRIKAIDDICTQAKFTDITKNFWVSIFYLRYRLVALGKLIFP